MESVRYRDGMLELGLLRNSLPRPSDVPADYRGPTIPLELLPLDDPEHEDPPTDLQVFSKISVAVELDHSAAAVMLEQSISQFEPDVAEGAL